MIWQLPQVRHLESAPLILVGNMWQGLVDWARTAMLSATGADEAIALIREHHTRWLERNSSG